MKPSRKKTPPPRGRRSAIATQAVPWWRSPNGLTVIAAVVVLIAIFAVLAVTGTFGGGGSTAPPGQGIHVSSVLQAVENPSSSVLGQVGAGGQPGHLTVDTSTPLLKDSSGKLQVIYVGAEYCPFCAAERWSMIMALSRFGSFSGIQETSSSSTDVYANTSTFTFVHASYTSATVNFSATEEEDRNQQPLQSPSAQVAQIFATYDTPPFTAQASAYPFFDIGNRYFLFETSYSPQLLQGLSWQQIATDLKNPSQPVAQAIIGNANILTAAICTANGMAPASVCKAAYLQEAYGAVNNATKVG